MDTRFLPRSEWLGERRTGCGTSDAAAANGVSHWKSELTLWAEKRGLLEDEADNDRFLMGREFEEPILRLWSARYGTPIESVRRHLMLRSTEYPHMIANPDGLVGHSISEPVLEIKTCSENDKSRWSVRIPPPYLYQAMHAMIVTGRRQCILIVAFGWSYPIEIVVDWDEDLAQDIIAKETEFWRRVVENDPPEIDGSESTLKTMRQRYYATERLKAKELPESALGLIEQYEVADGYLKTLKGGVNRVKSSLLDLLGDAEIGTINGVVLFTAKKAKDGSRRFKFYDRAA